MFINTGGTYDNINYSTMYHNTDKYLDVSPNKKYYIHMGNIDNENGPTDLYAILVFDMNTDKMVYAEAVNEDMKQYNEFEKYQHQMAKKLIDKLSWLQ